MAQVAHEHITQSTKVKMGARASKHSSRATSIEALLMPITWSHRAKMALSEADRVAKATTDIRH